jgi:hypothetical protein
VADNVEHLVGVNEGLRKSLQKSFEQNPSIPQRDLEGSIQQALLLMNHSIVQNALTNGDLKKRLAANKDDPELVRQAFLEVLARSPTADETDRYAKFLKESKNRDEATSDMLWVLINSAEFVTKR